MTSVTRFWSVILCVLCCAILPAQTADSVYTLAAEYRKSGMIPQAILEYKRYQFLCIRNGTEPLPESYLSLSDLYLAQADYDRSYEYLRRYLETGVAYTLSICAREMALMEKAGYPGNARIRLFILINKKTPDPTVRALLLLNGIKVAAKFHESENIRLFCHDAESIGLFDESESETISLFLEKIESFRPLNPRAMVVCSCIVPGSGQAIAGFYGNGLNSFVINGSLIGLSAFTLLNGDAMDFFMLELPAVIRFERGNVENARRLAERRNDEALDTLFLRIVEFAARKESGLRAFCGRKGFIE